MLIQSIKKLILVFLIFLSFSFGEQREADSTYWTAEEHSDLQPQIDTMKSIIKKTLKKIDQGIDYLAKKIDEKKMTRKEVIESRNKRLWKQYLKSIRGFKKTPTITPEKLNEILKDSSIILIDVRKHEEILISSLPGALTTEKFSNTYKSAASLKDKTIITFDTIGYRSGMFCQKLLNMKLEAKYLKGGLLAWTHINGALVKVNDKNHEISTDSLHVYNEHLQLHHPDYHGIW